MDNRGKKSVVLDLKKAEGKRAFHTLLDPADVFLSNVRVAALERLGLDGKSLLHLHPKLIVCSVSAYGPDGLDRDRPGYDVGTCKPSVYIYSQQCIVMHGHFPAPYCIYCSLGKE